METVEGVAHTRNCSRADGRRAQYGPSGKYKIRLAELWFLCSALLHNVLYQHLKFQVDNLSSFEVMAQTKLAQTDRLQYISQNFVWWGHKKKD